MITDAAGHIAHLQSTVVPFVDQIAADHDTCSTYEVFRLVYQNFGIVLSLTQASMAVNGNLTAFLNCEIEYLHYVEHLLHSWSRHVCPAKVEEEDCRA